MIRKILAMAAAAVGMTAIAEPALAQQNEQFIPHPVLSDGRLCGERRALR